MTTRPDRMVAILLFLLALFISQSRSATCYSYRGKEWANQTQCEGSQACCGVDDECLPNRLCKSPNAASNVLVRGPCLAQPYDRATCAQICAFDEVTQNTGLNEDVFPRVEICDEGVYCCRFGDATCCDKTIGLVYLDENGILLDSAPNSTTTAATSTGTTASDAASTPISSATSTPTSLGSDSDSGSQSDGGDSVALKAGLGVGIPAAAIIAALGTWFFIRRKQHRKTNASAPPTDEHAKAELYSDNVSPKYNSAPPSELPETHEMTHRPVEGTWNSVPHEVIGSEVPGAQYR